MYSSQLVKARKDRFETYFECHLKLVPPPKNTVLSSNYASPRKDHFLNSICLDLRSIPTIFLEMYQLLCKKSFLKNPARAILKSAQLD